MQVIRRSCDLQRRWARMARAPLLSAGSGEPCGARLLGASGAPGRFCLSSAATSTGWHTRDRVS
eukprot:2751694-Pyramimonas_sp.AAC.1